MNSEPQHAAYWLARARRLQGFVICIAWAESLLPWFIGANLVLCCVVLYARGTPFPLEWVFQLWLAALCLMGIVLWLFAWRRRPAVSDALLRMETALKLDNRLTTAYQGLTAWPLPQRRLPAFYHLHWPRQLSALAASLVFLLVCVLLPAREQIQNPLSEKPSPPLALAEVESWVEQLKEEEALVEEQALDQLGQAVEDLKSRPGDEWYTAGALEAAENLNEHTRNALASLARELQATSAILGGAPDLPSDLTENELQRVEQVFRESVAALESNALPLSSGLLEQLKQVDFDHLGAISPEQLEAMKNRTEQWSQACSQMGGMTDEERHQLQAYYDSLCSGGERQCKVGPGGIQRGRGDAEMSYSRYRSKEGTAVERAVSNEDLRNAAIGDRIHTTLAEQAEQAATFGGPVSGGTVQTRGSGGDAVWIDRLTPAERMVLRKHFK